MIERESVRDYNRYKDFLRGLIKLSLGVTLIPLIRLCVVFVAANQLQQRVCKLC